MEDAVAIVEAIQNEAVATAAPEVVEIPVPVVESAPVVEAIQDINQEIGEVKTWLDDAVERLETMSQQILANQAVLTTQIAGLTTLTVATSQPSTPEVLEPILETPEPETPEPETETVDPENAVEENPEVPEEKPKQKRHRFL